MGGGDTDWSKVNRKRAIARRERERERQTALNLADRLARGDRKFFAEEAPLVERALRQFAKT